MEVDNPDEEKAAEKAKPTAADVSMVKMEHPVFTCKDLLSKCSNSGTNIYSSALVDVHNSKTFETNSSLTQFCSLIFTLKKRSQSRLKILQFGADAIGYMDHNWDFE